MANGDDVSSPDGGAAMVATALERFGRIDIVINNAGNSMNQTFPATERLEDFTKTFLIHLGGIFNVTQAAWPHFEAQEFGRVVNITSSALLGLTADMSHLDESRRGNSGLSYPTMKAGMIGMTRSMANYGADRNIMVNAVAPAAATMRGAHNVTRLSTGEMLPLEPELVSVGVAVLVHETCPVSGEVFGVGGGKVDRLFTGATKGYLDVAITPERLMEHWDEVMALDDYWIPAHCRAHADALRQDRGKLLSTAETS